ncbi:hypothetical protein [Novosphingobium sp. BL-52-GroH]|uniref:hypothetical protein n=1 Tax=Novosphingobium sp. BL-52-GroH TaxID=3349877 RepID=UPI003850B465
MREEIPIWIAALQDKMTALALEVGDRLMVHARWSAAYSGYKEYQPFFEAIGFGDQARACQLSLGEHGDIAKVVGTVSDEMVEAFVTCSPVDEVLEKIEPFWDVVDSLCPISPYRDLAMDQLTEYNAGLYQLVATARARVGGVLASA